MDFREVLTPTLPPTHKTNNMAQQTYGEWMRSNPPIPNLTAVEWLIIELNQELNYIPITQWDRIRDIVQRAKQMEKEQIVEAFSEGYTYGGHEVETINGEQYYKEQYVQGSTDIQ